jgi:hypothetical protein
MKTLILSLLLSTTVVGHSMSNSEMYREVHGNGVYTVAERSKANRQLRELREEIERGGIIRLAYRSEQALDGIIDIAYRNLRFHGHKRYAEEVKAGWEEHRGTVMAIALNFWHGERVITDYAPLSAWLAKTTQKIIEALGWEIAHTLRVTDLHSLNFGLKYIFAMACENGKEEFLYHFAEDPHFRAVFPVIAYWTANITCSIATFGVGYFFVCSPISLLVQWGAEKIAPGLGEKIYGWACE